MNPTKYTPNYSFTGFQTQDPKSPLPAIRVDDELSRISSSLGDTIDALSNVRRSDGKLANQTVGPDQLSAALNIGFTNRGTWTSGVSYSAGDGVSKGTAFYSARVANTAAAPNAPDVDTTTWQLLFTLTSNSLPPDGSVTQPMMDPTYDGSLARVADQTFTGVPKAPTAAAGTNTTQLATTAFVAAAFTALASGVSGAYDTLNEIATDLMGRWNATVVRGFSNKTPVDTDVFAGLDSANSFSGVGFTLVGLKAALAPVYQPLATVLTNFVALIGTVAAGDLLIGSGAHVLGRLAKDSDGKVLTLVSGLPAWGSGAGGLTLLSSGTPSNGASTYVVTGLSTSYVALLMLVEGVGHSSGGMSCTISADNGSSFDATALTLDGGGASVLTNVTAQIFGTGDTTVKPAISIAATSPVSTLFASKTGPTNAVRLNVASFNGTGTVKIYGVK